MLNKTRPYLLPIIFVSLFSSVFSMNTKINDSFIKNIDIEKIKEKEIFYKNLFDPKRKLKIAAIVSTGVFSTILFSYMGFKCWSKKFPKTTDNSSTEKIDLENEIEKHYQEKSERKKSILKTVKHSSVKGAGKGIVAFITIYIAYDILNPAKNALINFFKSSDKEHFQRIILNLSSSLKQLQELFTLENGECYKEEIIDHYNFFIENVENFLAIISATSTKKINTIGKYQSINSEQRLTYKNVFKFSENLNTVLNESNNIFFDESMANQILRDFKQINNQIFRSIKLTKTVIYES